MDCMVYFKDSTNKLCSIKTANQEDVASAFLDVEEYLYNKQELYNKPLLAVLEGGNPIA